MTPSTSAREVYCFKDLRLVRTVCCARVLVVFPLHIQSSMYGPFSSLFTRFMSSSLISCCNTVLLILCTHRIPTYVIVVVRIRLPFMFKSYVT